MLSQGDFIPDPAADMLAYCKFNSCHVLHYTEHDEQDFPVGEDLVLGRIGFR